jgi:hypothetical protein
MMNLKIVTQMSASKIVLRADVTGRMTDDRRQDDKMLHLILSSPQPFQP